MRVLLATQGSYENAESTKLGIVYDASARENSRSFSLNDCLETGPALQNLLQSVLIRTRFKPIAVRRSSKAIPSNKNQGRRS